MKKELNANFHIRKGKIFVYPHTDEKRHSHIGLLALFLILLILFVYSLSFQTTANIAASNYEIGSQNGMRPFFDLIRLLLEPVT